MIVLLVILDQLIKLYIYNTKPSFDIIRKFFKNTVYSKHWHDFWIIRKFKFDFYIFGNNIMRYYCFVYEEKCA